MMKRAVLYCRVSTKEQEKGNSLDWQEEYLRKCCAIRKYEVVKVFRDDKSGKTFKGRTEFINLMKYCKAHKGEIDYVLVYRWDRYSRNLKEALINLDYFWKRNIEVNSVEQQVDFRAPEYITYLSLYISAAETEDTKISRRTKECIHKARESGKCVHKAPRGYVNRQLDDEHRYVEIDETEAEQIRTAFKEVAKGVMTPTAVCRRMNRNGFKIHKNSFFKVLRNPFYVGDIYVPEYKDDHIGTIPAHYVKGLHEAIIDRDTFDAVQDVLDGKRRSTPKTTKVLDPDLYLRKYISCPVCGAPLTGSACTGNGGKYYYYNCSRDGKHFRCSAPKAHELFRRYVATLKPNKAVLKLYEAILDDIRMDKNRELNAEIAKLEQELGKCNERMESASTKYMDDEIDKKTYESFIKQIDTARKKVENRLFLLKNDKGAVLKPRLDYSMLLIGNLEHYMEDAPVEAKCKLIGSMFPEKIEFDGKSYRTTRYNAVLDLIYQQTSELRGTKKEDFSVNSEKSPLVPPQGLEPWTPTLRVSCSTN